MFYDTKIVGTDPVNDIPLFDQLPLTSKKTCFELRRRHHRKLNTKDPTSTAAPNDNPLATADVLDDLLMFAVVKKVIHVNNIQKLGIS